MNSESPATLPHPRPGPGFQTCNNTARLFLGSARKSWMAGIANPSSPRSPQPAVDSCLSYRRKANPVNAASYSAPPASQPAATLATTGVALMSPVTPSETVPHRDPEPPPSTASVAAPGVSPVPPPTLPSPAPSSHNTSPAEMSNGTTEELYRTVPSVTPPTQPVQVPSRTSETVPVDMPSTASNGMVGVPTPTQPSPDSALAPSHGPPDGSERSVDGYFWHDLQTRLDSFLGTAAVARNLSGKMDGPRAQLLRDACVEQDLLYLAFHQAYCLHSCDSSRLAALGFASSTCNRGFQTAEELLLPCSSLSPALLNWSVNFPLELSQMMSYPEYRGALLQVTQCLIRFSEQWDNFTQAVMWRQYPPLIDELVCNFNVNSSVLLRVIFLSMCRRIHSPAWEQRLKSLFAQDRQNYERRFSSHHISPAQMQRENDKIIQKYLAIRAQQQPRIQNAAPRAMARVPRGNPAHNNPQPNQMASTQPLSSTQPLASSRPGPVPSQTPRPIPAVGRPDRGELQNAVVASPQPLQTPTTGWGTQQSSAMASVPRHQQLQSQPSRYPMFLPPPGYVAPMTVRPNSLRVALHQAHLRDPVKILVPRGQEGKHEVELFQYMTSFAVPPSPLGRVECAFHWKFSLSDNDIRRFPLRSQRGQGQRDLRAFAEGCRVYHLRCIKISPSVKEVDQQSWSVADSAWPSVIYVFVNGAEHFVRRKVHHGKDLPLDITDSLRHGENEISFHFIRNEAECNDVLYALGVEVMDISNFAQVRQLARDLPAAECNARIRKQLSSSADDELSIVNDDITVNLFDPFTARIFDNPARGSVCHHLECFDLDTFIMTRASKSGKGPMECDWRCPICREDARPQSLVIDGYLASVRAHLAAISKLDDAKAISIKSDGSWELKVDQDTQTPEKAQRRDRTPGALPAKRKPDDTSSPLAQRSPQRLKPDDSSRPEPHNPPESGEVIELD